MKIKISELLKLKSEQIEHCNIHRLLEIFNYLTGILISDIATDFTEEFNSKLTEFNYSFDSCCDNRERTLRIFFYDNKPVLVYQIIGRGYEIETYELLDSTFISTILSSIVINNINTQITNIEEEFEVLGYNTYEPIIKENKIVYEQES